MNNPTIEELRSQEAHADTNFTELQALRKIHLETLKKLDAAEGLVVQLEDENRQLRLFTVDNINKAIANATNCEPATHALQGALDKNSGGTQL